MNTPREEQIDLHEGTDDAQPAALRVIEEHHGEHDQPETGETEQKLKAREVAKEIIFEEPKGFGVPENDGEEGKFVARPAPEHRLGQEPIITKSESVEVDDAQQDAERAVDITPAAAAEIEGTADQARNGNNSLNGSTI